MIQRDSNLLFGILAVQLRLATPQQLVAAGAVWAVAVERSLGEILVEQGVLRQRDRDLIDELLARQLEASQGDSAQVYELYGGDSAALASFGGSLVFEQQGDQRYASLAAPVSDAQATPSIGGGPAELGGTDILPTEQSGRYSMGSEQGRGGIGRVLLAFDASIGREIALKELLQGGSTSGHTSGGSPAHRSAAHVARFLREARITGQLEHPGIVPVYELGQRADGSVYYTMKLVRGTTLADKLKTCRSLGERLALLPHFLDLCQAIAYAHSRGVVHRDIKPANVMIGAFGETVLLDWGLAKVRGQADIEAEKLADEVRLFKEVGAADSVAGRPIGTPSYMPPEQADGRIADVDERSDVWSLGAVLYELLTGKPPYTGVTAFDVIGAVLTEEVRPAQERCKDAPPELAAIALRCLQREPALRYQHVNELASDVTAFHTGGLVSAYSYSVPLMLRRWARRHWAVLATAGVALLVLCAVTAFSYSKVLEQRNAALAANRKLDQSKDELLSFKLATESHRAFAESRTELASLLALEAAKYYRRSAAWMPEADAALRDCAGSFGYCRDLIGHGSQVRRVASSPDGTMLASCSDDATIRIWSMSRQGGEARILSGHERNVACVAFSADNASLVSASHDGTARIWDAKTGAARRVLKGHTGPLWAVALSPDGRWLATGGIDLQADGKPGPTHDVWLWNLAGDDAPVLLHGHTGYVQCVVFSPDGKLLASCGEDQTIRLWDMTANGKPLRVLDAQKNNVMWLAFSPDGTTLASAHNAKVVLLWDVAAPASPPRVLAGHEGPVGSLTFSRDGKLLASGSGDETIRIWDLANPEHAPRVLGKMGKTVWSLAFNADATLLAAACPERAVHLWDLTVMPSSPQHLEGHVDMVRDLAVSPSGELLASAGKDQTIRLWRLGQPDTPPQALPAHEDLIAALAFSPDGARLASGSWDKTIRLWDLGANPPASVALAGHTDYVRDVAFSPDGKLLASASDDCTVRVWNVEQPAGSPRVLRGPTESAMAVAFSPDAHFLAVGGADAKVWLWDLSAASSKPPIVLRGAEDAILAVAFSPDGKWLAAGGFDQNVRLWSLAEPDGQPLTLRGHDREIFSVAFSPDGRLLASCSRDHTVRLWNLERPGSESEILDNHGRAVMAVVFTPDGRRLASAGVDPAINLWPVDSLELADMIAPLPRRNLTADEWQKYVSVDMPYSRTLENLPAGFGAPGGPSSKRRNNGAPPASHGP